MKENQNKTRDEILRLVDEIQQFTLNKETSFSFEKVLGKLQEAKEEMNSSLRFNPDEKIIDSWSDNQI